MTASRLFPAARRQYRLFLGVSIRPRFWALHQYRQEPHSGRRGLLMLSVQPWQCEAIRLQSVAIKRVRDAAYQEFYIGKARFRSCLFLGPYTLTLPAGKFRMYTGFTAASLNWCYDAVKIFYWHHYSILIRCLYENNYHYWRLHLRTNTGFFL